MTGVMKRKAITADEIRNLHALKTPQALERKKLVIIIGAGASIPMGIPAMKGFTKEFETHCNDDQLIDLYIKFSLRYLKKVAHLGRDWDLEELLSRVRELKNAESSAITKMYRKYSFKGNSKPKDKFDQKISSMAQEYSELERELLRFIREKCIRPDIGKGIKIYASLFNLSKYFKLEIFTTNYDSVIENVCDSLNIRYADGFMPKGNSGYFTWTPESLNTQNFNLFKLHGSITWYKDSNGRIIKFPIDISGTRDVQSVIIYPTEYKELFRPPFNRLYFEFSKSIFNSTGCLAIGHSFRDLYMKELLLEKVRQGDYKLTIVDPFAKSIREKKFGNSKNVNPNCMTLEAWVENNLDDYISDLSKK
ncbi:SIR2-like domain protein [uncultured archaeon]|nr:SIR2-like domain protein [uncultured archaeon]